VRLAAQLVNTLVDGEAGGKPFTAPRQGLRAAAVLNALRSADPYAEEISGGQADHVTEFAGRLRAVFTAAAEEDFTGAAHEVNRLLGDTATQPELVLHGDDPRWHLHYRGTAGGAAATWAGACAAALAAVLGSGAARDRLGVCTAPRCDRVYVDTSHNGRRRFCTLACQNRVKTAAFRARNRPPQA
jgi:predicted RNA-binding Zn ribbon-like protein